MMDRLYDAVVLGGGFFGAALATHLRRGGARTLLIESRPELLGRASMNNQARVHVGYHYPRSYLTGLRSRMNAPRFAEEYRDCIHDDFTHYYAVARSYSNVTASQFKRFCDRIGATVESAPPNVVRLFNPALIEDVVVVPEYTFDAVRLRAHVGRDLAGAGVEVAVNTTAQRVTSALDGWIDVVHVSGANEGVARTRQVFNCTYAGLNRLHTASGLPIVPLKHELTELALVEPPSVLSRAAVTVMCGPFFSMLPYSARCLHTLSHVRYTPHVSWMDSVDGPYVDPDVRLAQHSRHSHFPHMMRDAARYLPVMRECRQVESLWEVKTVLPRSEVDDSRPILFSHNHGMPGFHCVIGSKMDNVYDMLRQSNDVQPVAGLAP